MLRLLPASLLVLTLTTSAVYAGNAAEMLPMPAFESTNTPIALVANAAFAPDADAQVATPFEGVLEMNSAMLQTTPTLERQQIGGRDAGWLPAVSLTLYTVGQTLVPAERGTLVGETGRSGRRSYWSVIAEPGRVWREARDNGWCRAALPVTLANDTENAAVQGLMTFLYREGQVSSVRLQFVQQTGPYLVKPHFTATARVAAKWHPQTVSANERAAYATEAAAALPVHSLADYAVRVPAGTFDGFGGPLLPQYRVLTALVGDGALWLAPVDTPAGPYPYPTGMRFGVRSVMKSVAAPLALLHLAQEYGPWVLNLKIGHYVAGLDPKYGKVRFVDAAGMASGFGGHGTLKTHPNDLMDGYLDGDYDAWYLAPSHAAKVAEIRRTQRPYPWAPGTVVRYRDQDYYLLGVALDHFLKETRGPQADLGEMLQAEVLAPIGVYHLPAVRTREAEGRGYLWANAGYYPTVDDLAKIALLYQRRGEWGGRQLLHRELTDDVLAARGALEKAGDAVRPSSARGPQARYRLGFHYEPYVSARDGHGYEVPTMQGSGENLVVLAPNGLIAIRTAKASGLPSGTLIDSDDRDETLRVMERLAPFQP